MQASRRGRNVESTEEERLNNVGEGRNCQLREDSLAGNQKKPRIRDEGGGNNSSTLCKKRGGRILRGRNLRTLSKSEVGPTGEKSPLIRKGVLLRESIGARGGAFPHRNSSRLRKPAKGSRTSREKEV